MKEDLVIGETYEFNDCEEFIIAARTGELLCIDNNNKENKYWCKINNWQSIGYKHIRPIQKEEIEEPRFIETDIVKSITEDENKNGHINEYICKLPGFIKDNFKKMNLSGIPIPIDSVLSYGAIGFKFKEHKEQIFNSPIIYIVKKNSDVFTQAVASESNDFDVLRANKVVWLNPKYKK